MYSSNMSWKPMAGIFEELIAEGLLLRLSKAEYVLRADSVDDNGETLADGRSDVWYVITEKGKTVLAGYLKLYNLLGESREPMVIPTPRHRLEDELDRLKMARSKVIA
jgi:predicted transcriptional regulator